MTKRIPVPEAGEYAAFQQKYVERVAGEDVEALLRRQPEALRAALEGLGEAELRHRYAPGKWSVQEVAGHLADTERIFSYRLFRLARGDATPQAGFAEGEYVAAAAYDAWPLQEILSDFALARAGTLSVLRRVKEGEWKRVGVANGREVSVRALAHITAGHVEHHLAVLRERYGVRVPESVAAPVVAS